MYIPHQNLQAIHQDIVDDCLKRAEQRRMLKELQQRTEAGTKGWKARATVTWLVRSMLGVAARP